MTRLEDELINQVNRMIIKECRPVALKYFGKATPVFEKLDRKQDPFNSYTHADIQLEKIIKIGLSRIVRDYGFIGEESSYKERLERKIAPLRPSSGRYWVIDPIDGTFAFRNGLDSWGISVGLMEETGNGTFKNILGSVYFPCPDTMFYSDGKVSYETLNASNRSSKTNILLPPRIEELKRNNIVTVGNDKTRVSEFLTDKLIDEMPGSYVAQVLGVVKGRYLGTIMRARLWDMAGCHAVAKNLGVKIYDGKTLEEIENFKRRDFIDDGNQKWKLKRTCIVCYDFAKENLFSRLRTNP